jgi:Asp-tRNA(Asn)/Glu-tRNA(Gln) amidotransferase C subunit
MSIRPYIQQETYRSKVPKEHPHRAGTTIRRSGEVSVVCPGATLHRNRNAVIGSAALAVVVRLEVERRLGEAVSVCDIVDAVDDVERVGARSVEIDLRRRRSTGVLREDEVQGCGGLRSDAALCAFERDGVVSCGGTNKGIRKINRRQSKILT